MGLDGSTRERRSTRQWGLHVVLLGVSLCFPALALLPKSSVVFIVSGTSASDLLQQAAAHKVLTVGSAAELAERGVVAVGLGRSARIGSSDVLSGR